MALHVDSEKDLPAAVRQKIAQASPQPARSRRRQLRPGKHEPWEGPSTSMWACMAPGCRKISKSWAEAEGHSDTAGHHRIAIVL